MVQISVLEISPRWPHNLFLGRMGTFCGRKPAGGIYEQEVPILDDSRARDGNGLPGRRMGRRARTVPATHAAERAGVPGFAGHAPRPHQLLRALRHQRLECDRAVRERREEQRLHAGGDLDGERLQRAGTGERQGRQLHP